MEMENFPVYHSFYCNETGKLYSGVLNTQKKAIKYLFVYIFKSLMSSGTCSKKSVIFQEISLLRKVNHYETK